jgi:3-dehydroquinate dehydratase-2
MMQILVLQGPNLNMLGWISRQTGTRLTLDKLNRELRHTARELGVELKIYQSQSEVVASRIVQRQRNKVDGVLLMPGIWASSGHLLQETLALAELPLAVFHLVMESGPWPRNSPSIFKDLARIEDEGMNPDELTGCLSRFAEQL